MVTNEVLLFLFPGANALRDWGIQTDGAGPYIAAWRRPEPQPTPAEIAAAMLPATKAARIAAINAECERRITSIWPLPRQNSAMLLIYGQATLDAMRAFIDAHIAASNTASDAVDAAQTVAAVEAVTVAWPV